MKTFRQFLEALGPQQHQGKYGEVHPGMLVKLKDGKECVVVSRDFGLDGEFLVVRELGATHEIGFDQIKTWEHPE